MIIMWERVRGLCHIVHKIETKPIVDWSLESLITKMMGVLFHLLWKWTESWFYTCTFLTVFLSINVKCCLTCIQISHNNTLHAVLSLLMMYWMKCFLIIDIIISFLWLILWLTLTLVYCLSNQVTLIMEIVINVVHWNGFISSLHVVWFGK